MPLSMTSKEWVIPPRPKPGRKPATDTPPTKRKAQNRAAQRAFRERRAARVGELEEQLEAEKEEHDKVEQELRERMRSLELESEGLRTRCQMLENMLNHERTERGKVTAELETVRRKWNEETGSQRLRRGSMAPSLFNATQQYGSHSPAPQQSSSLRHRASRSSTSSLNAAPAPRSSLTQPFSISQIISPPDEVEEPSSLSCGSCGPSGSCACADEVLTSSAIGCGKCSLGTRCECLEAAVNGGSSLSIPSQSQDLKRPRPASPSPIAPDEKRQRANSSVETDFTALFSQKKRNSSATTAAYDSGPADLPQPSIEAATEGGCGFCKEGTYCVCADTIATSSVTLPPLSVTAPPAPMSQQIQTPPPDSDYSPAPMEIMADGAVKLPRLQTSRNTNPLPLPVPTKRSGCGPNGPGTCAQCLADPKSGLFCRSLAANFQRLGRDGGCCGGGGAGGGCCKAKAPTSTPAGTATTSSPATPQLSRGEGSNKKSLGLSLSCADAYKTLASHRHFDEAADDIGAWLPLLKAAPKRASASEAEGRTPIEVEAASIMSVLKGFDVRFGN
ncbi:BZIP transcription factor [Pleurostoma richardsiae]|uniref:BZIP transcription factor n=1 Tax=Pleurostoma richardsiae TaxID=41990 RepID=A0AA38RF51_9PEZI|nr:BZIP transcription factor [Pleurostoma richardsiae]